MDITRRMILSVPGVLLAGSLCHAQGSMAVWSEWADGPWKRQGPQDANGLLLYLHEEGREEQPVALVFAAMARAAGWDILRVNRRASVDLEANDVDILEFMSTRIHRAREEGYGHITVGGIARGGWLAALASTLAGVDAAIVLAPAKEADAGKLADRLGNAKAARVAVVLFGDDPRAEQAAGTAAAASTVRRALQRTPSRFMVVKRPPDLLGKSAPGSGRFARRYRDALVQFVQDGAAEPGEVICPPLSGYAVGVEIGFTAPDPSKQRFPAIASPALAPFWGARWEGDDENGTYVILQAITVFRSIGLRIGCSAGPASRRPWAGVMQEVSFEIDGGGRRLYSTFDKSPNVLVVTLMSETELELEDRRNAPYRRMLDGPARLRNRKAM